jgi:ABC-type multidrug transport system fused ATPase/permease subunit
VFVSFLLYTTMFVAPIEVIGQMVRTINRATSSAHRVFEVLDSEPEVKDVPQAVRLSPVSGRRDVRQRDVRVRRRAADPAGHLVRRAAGRARGTRGTVGRRQVDGRESDRALL